MDAHQPGQQCSKLNALADYIRKSGLDETETMNFLTESGVVADNAVYPEDVAIADQQKAIALLCSFQCQP